MKDNQVQDALAVAKNTLFIRSPQTNVPYNPPALTDIDKMKIDGALMGRGLHCEFGFEPVNLNTGNFYMDQTDASLNDLGGEFGITRSYNSKGTDQNSLLGRGWSFNLAVSGTDGGRKSPLHAGRRKLSVLYRERGRQLHCSGRLCV